MERVVKLLNEEVGENFRQLILSNPLNRDEVAKIKVRPVIIKDRLFFQVNRFVGTKVFHDNLSKDDFIKATMDLITNSFRQMEMDSVRVHAVVLISKKGKVTVKIKQKNRIDDMKDINNMNESGAEANAHNRTKRYILNEGVVVPFLVDLGVQTTEGKIVHAKYNKFKQINRFLEYVQDILPVLPNHKKITILDFGCGKSYLTFALYYYLKILKKYDIEVIGLDLKKDVIARCNQLRDKYGYDELTFLEGDIKEYSGKDCVDMVVTLHACDTATDYAIYKAISWNAKVILSVPCCQHELNAQMKSQLLNPILRYGILKERMSALITDGIRANLLEREGYDTQLLEFIDIDHTPKNLLIRAIKNQDNQRMQKRQYGELERLQGELHCELTLEKLLNGKRTL